MAEKEEFEKLKKEHSELKRLSKRGEKKAKEEFDTLNTTF